MAKCLLNTSALSSENAQYVRNLPFKEIAHVIFQETHTPYELNITFCTDTLSQKFNNTYRKKNKPTDVLSFPLDDSSGEIFINIDAVRRNHESHKHTVSEHILFLFIHGCLHLKGFEHGSRMEDEEDRLMQFARTVDT